MIFIIVVLLVFGAGASGFLMIAMFKGLIGFLFAILWFGAMLGFGIAICIILVVTLFRVYGKHRSMCTGESVTTEIPTERKHAL